jgi:hypothetical protein
VTSIGLAVRSARKVRVGKLRARVVLILVLAGGLMPLAHASPLSPEPYRSLSAEFAGRVKSPILVHLCDGGGSSTKVMRARINITSDPALLGVASIRVALSESGSLANVERVTIRGRGSLSGTVLSGLLPGEITEGGYSSSGTVRGLLVRDGQTIGHLAADLSLTVDASLSALHGAMGAAGSLDTFGTVWQEAC